VVGRLAPQYVALLGIDLKGGLELSVYRDRLSGLATTRQQAADMLAALLELAMDRMEACRLQGVRAVWELKTPPPPVVVLVDEIAELYLVTNPKDRDEQALRDRTAVLLLRLAQLGAALDVHLLISGQRFGADLGQDATALRAQLGGRVLLHVSDKETAVMVLGDVWPEAVATAQQITPDQRGTAVAADGEGSWIRARSVLTTADEAKQVAEATSVLTSVLPGIEPPRSPREWRPEGGEG
jgi:DNA segregation ATPase FtsK/SpoIIIE, S-DNA-T family